MARAHPKQMNIFKKNNIFDIPDFLCNARWRDLLLLRVCPERRATTTGPRRKSWRNSITKMTQAFHGVLDMALKQKVYMRDAAYMVAIDRVAKAMQLRGWI